MNNENEPPARMQQQGCHGAKRAIKFAWPNADSALQKPRSARKKKCQEAAGRCAVNTHSFARPNDACVSLVMRFRLFKNGVAHVYDVYTIQGRVF